MNNNHNKLFESRDKALTIYLRELRNNPTLDITLEKELIKMASMGDLKAQHQLCQNHLGLVVHIARKYVHSHFTVSDLVAPGNVGLVLASQKIVDREGFMFSYHATPYIKREILEHIRKNESTIRIMSSHSSNKSIRFENQYVSLDLEIESNGSIDSLSSMIEDKEISDPGTLLLINEQNTIQTQKVNKLLSILSPLKQRVFRMFFGLYPFEISKTTKEIAQIEDLTVSRINQIIAEGTKTMQNA